MASIIRAGKRAGLRVGFQVLRVYWAVRRPKAAGVKCAVVDGERVALVRHTYGDRHVWDLPGGAIKRDETPLGAGRREVLEEIGVETRDWRELGDIYLIIRGKRNRLYGCAATVEPGTPLVADEVEIARADWFERDALPEHLTPWVRLFTEAAIGHHMIARGTQVTPAPRAQRRGKVPRP